MDWKYTVSVAMKHRNQCKYLNYKQVSIYMRCLTEPSRWVTAVPEISFRRPKQFFLYKQSTRNCEFAFYDERKKKWCFREMSFLKERKETSHKYNQEPWCTEHFHFLKVWGSILRYFLIESVILLCFPQPSIKFCSENLDN